MLDSNRLDGKIALITGASGGIGRATAMLFVARGARVIAVDFDEKGLAALAKDLPADAVTIKADVSNEDDVRSYVAQAMSAAGRIDVFFNNAGVEGEIHLIPEYPVEAFRRVIDINVVGVFLGMKHVIPIMVEQGGGSIINTSSIGGVTGQPSLAPYIASKHAVIGMTRVAAAEWGAKNVRVNTVNPGPVEGRMIASIFEGSAPGKGEEAMKAAMDGMPSKRFSTAEEIATMVAFLASDDARHVHGAMHFVDGGFTAL